MKISEKAILIGIISFIAFLFANIFIGNIIGLIIPGGDAFINSYFLPLYAGVTSLTSIVISCTYIVVKRINHLLDALKDK